MKFSIRVHPGTSREKLVKDANNSFSVYLTKKAQKGEANKALRKLLAKEFDVAPSKIRIVQGEKSRFKIIEIA
jgi:uncharacterized protein (TIGR00251 family)